MAKKQSRKKDLRPQSTTPLEWAVAAVGLIIVAGMIGLLGWFGIRHTDRYPQIEVQVIRPVQSTAGGFHVGFSARNLKSATAAQVRIQGELQVGGQVVEKRSARLDYLPGFSRRDGGLFFGRDPRQGKLILRAESYQEP